MSGMGCAMGGVSYPALSAVSDSGDATKTGITATLSGASVQATPVGGTPSFTYLWSKVSGDTITIDSSTADTTTFTATGMVSPETRVALFKCTVTDALGAVQATRNITITITRS